MGAQRATIVELGGGIREYAVDERLCWSPIRCRRSATVRRRRADPVAQPPRRRALQLRRREHRLDLSEPAAERHPGLMRWRPWTGRARTRTCGHAGCTAADQRLSVCARARDPLRAGRRGLAVSTTAANVGEHACPYGAGQHPYLSPGSGPSTSARCSWPPPRDVTNEGRMIPTAGGGRGDAV